MNSGRDSQSVEEEGKVRVELPIGEFGRPLFIIKRFNISCKNHYDEWGSAYVLEAGGGEHQDHEHIGTNPEEDSVCSAITIIIGLFGGSITVFFLLRWPGSKSSLARCPHGVDIFARLL